MAEDRRAHEDAREEGELPNESIPNDPDFMKKHPLQHSWTLWFDPASGKRQTTANWGSNLTSVYTFNTVEDFWCLFNNIIPLSSMQGKHNIYVFKEGIKPAWEDSRNQNGGTWTVVVNRGGPDRNAIDQKWLNTLMAMIGEQFTEGEYICGIAANIRPKGPDRLGLWTAEASNEAAQTKIGKELRQFLDVQEGVPLGYVAHNDQKGGGKAKDRYQA